MAALYLKQLLHLQRCKRRASNGLIIANNYENLSGQYTVHWPCNVAYDATFSDYLNYLYYPLFELLKNGILGMIFRTS